jgi:hypothetical protein
MKLTIEEVESRLEQSLKKSDALQSLVPKGYRVQVALLDQNARKKRRTASAQTWSPESGLIRISFERESEDASDAQAPKSVSDSLADLVRSLDRAESRPGYTFVALKWFRDVALPADAPAWAQSVDVRSDVLRDAIERRMLLTGRIPNPKSPQFPVTTIKLNRLNPEVRTVLGTVSSNDEDFEPIAIRGESLSATVLRERR